MLRADEPLELLVERLVALPAPDRRAVLTHLSPAERSRVTRMMDRPAVSAPPVYSADIQSRIEEPAQDGVITAATRAALSRMVAGNGRVAPPMRGPSLLARLAGALRGR